jgi:hypothetical protein
MNFYIYMTMEPNEINYDNFDTSAEIYENRFYVGY